MRKSKLNFRGWVGIRAPGVRRWISARKTRVAHWMSMRGREARQSLASTIILVVRIAAVGYAVYILATTTGPLRNYALAAIAVLIGAFVIDRSSRYWALRAFGLGFMADYENRRLEYRRVVRNMNQTLEDFKLPILEPGELSSIGDPPPAYPAEDLKRCCERFALRLNDDPDAQLLELLYLGSRGLDTQALWGQAKQKQKQKLTGVLVRSKQLDVFKNRGQTASAVKWILDRIDRFDMKRVKSEIQALAMLWRHVGSYADYLRLADLAKEVPDMSSRAQLGRLMCDIDEEFSEKLLSQINYEEVAEHLLGKRGGTWIRAWALENYPHSVKDADSLALVSLGMYTANTAVASSPLLVRLAKRVAHDNGNAVEILFAHLWRKSKVGSYKDDGFRLSALANWAHWVKEAEREMSKTVSNEVRGVLHSGLTNDGWLTWLPIHSAATRLITESQHVYECVGKLESGIVLDEAEQRTIDALLVEFQIAPPGAILSPDQLSELRAAVNKKYEIAGRTPHSAQEVEEHINDFVANTFRNETRMAGYLGKYQTILDTLAVFRERAADLTRQLEDLGREIEAEATGSAYLITFDQIRGPLADLIDSLRDLYNFKPYTRYARVGKLRSGQGFESFYRDFEADLKQLIDAAVNTAEDIADGSTRPYRLIAVGEMIGADIDSLNSVISAIESEHSDWKQVEITVQQVSFLHRHDFVVDADCKDPIRKIFENPPGTKLSVDGLMAA